MTRAFDAIVLGGDPDALVASIGLARGGAKVLLIDANADLGGAFREIEFSPGFRAAPLAPDAGYLSPEVIQAIGTLPEVAATADPSLISLADSAPPLVLLPSVSQTAQALKAFSSRDAERWPLFTAEMASLAQFLAALYRAPAPRIDATQISEFAMLARLGRRYRALGRRGMVELLRTLPMALADLLDDWFESDRLKGALAALGVMDVCQGPMSGGTAFTFLHRHVGAPAGVFSERLRLKGGAKALVAALAQRARSLGVTIETGTAARQVIVKEGRVAGVLLASGEPIVARTVVSSFDPVRSLLELVDPVHLDPETLHAVRSIRFRGVTTKILVALESLPSVPGATAAPAGAVLIAPDVRHVERAYDATKYGRCADAPFIELRFPSITQPELAPEGKHVAVLHVQFTPYRLREGGWESLHDALADRVLALVEAHLPGFTARVRERVVLSPVDLERDFGLREGAVSQGEMMLDQILFMRPIPACSRYATPLAGYFLCGAGTHPGAGITGTSGWLASRAAAMVAA